ncbi:MAG: metallophosphoesterase family protein [Chloroflexia bacterium]|nr:metallophosphoesterase family protein [Chloroflexia bacterium]
MNVLVISDIHANLAALQAVLEAAPAVDAIWNLGDTVGYGPRPRECVDTMVDLTFTRPDNQVLVGNHDLACLGDIDLAEFNPAAEAAGRWTAHQLGMDHQEYLGSLPAMTIAEGYTLAHASPRSPVWEYVTSVPIATDNFGHFDTDACFIGHTHVAMFAALRPGASHAELGQLRDGDVLELSGARFLINPGSVGQPRDRDPRAAFSILDTVARTLTARRVEYDIAKTQRQMALANLPDVLMNRLSHGI